MSNEKVLIERYWELFAAGKYFQAGALLAPGARVLWPNTGEVFTQEEFVRVNQHYPGSWKISVESLETMESGFVSVVKVESRQDAQSFYAVSFFKLKDGLIAELTEYWGENAPSGFREGI